MQKYEDFLKVTNDLKEKDKRAPFYKRIFISFSKKGLTITMDVSPLIPIRDKRLILFLHLCLMLLDEFLLDIVRNKLIAGEAGSE